MHSSSSDVLKRDEEMIHKISEIVGIPENHVLVLLYEPAREWPIGDYVVFLPARETEMTSEHFPEVAIAIEDAIWEIYRSRYPSTTHCGTYGTIYAIDETDEESLIVDGMPMSFDDLCRQQDDKFGIEIDMQAWLACDVNANYDGTRGKYFHNEVKEENLFGKAYEVL